MENQRPLEYRMNEGISVDLCDDKDAVPNIDIRGNGGKLLFTMYFASRQQMRDFAAQITDAVDVAELVDSESVVQ